MGFSGQLKRLKEEELALIEKKKKLFETRKNEIGRLAEKIEVFYIEDEVIAGALLAAKNSNAEIIAGFKAEGARFLESRKNSPATQKVKPSPKPK